MVNSLYTVWVKIDDTLPWIELKGTYETRSQARKAAKAAVGKLEVKITQASDQKKQERPLAILRANR